MSAGSGEVEVFLRFRPTANFAEDVIQCLPDGRTVKICYKKESRKPSETDKNQMSSMSFQLEGLLQNVSQEDVYARVGRPVLLGALNGYNGTVMCFGQTGAGKTYTMTGSTESYKQRGIIPRALQEVFQEVQKRVSYAFSVQLSYLEIYNENLVDLLRDSTQPLHDIFVSEEPGGGVTIKGLSLHRVRSEEEALNLLFEGEMNRMLGSHTLNRNSSRSHCIFTVHIESHSHTISDAKYITSKLNLVDLAGSERVEKTGSEGQMLTDAKYINKSLSFLEQTILALADSRRDHIPFRQCKLTHALKDSLGGNCNTVLVANVYGEAAQIKETLSTLRFACRMKCVRTEPVVNEHRDPVSEIKKLKSEVAKLKEELSFQNLLGRRPRISYESMSEAQRAEIRNEVQRYLDGSLKEINIISICQVQAVFAEFKRVVQEQKTTTQFGQTYNIVDKVQSARKSPLKACETKGSIEDIVASLSVQTQRYTPRPGSTKAKTRRSKQKLSVTKGPAEVSPSPRKRPDSSSKSKATASKEMTPPLIQPISNGQYQSDSPPPKTEAFEDFKVGQGSHINGIFKENKILLLERRSLLRQLTERVNGVKREIDGTMATIQQHRDARESKGQYLSKEEEEAADATLLSQLRELKTEYRATFKTLGDMKAEVNYCQQLVDQCRLRLLSEFEDWYEKSFLLTEEEIVAQEAQYESRAETGAEAFYNSRSRIQRRRKSRALAEHLQNRGTRPLGLDREDALTLRVSSK